jgi:hypothetical protein
VREDGIEAGGCEMSIYQPDVTKVTVHKGHNGWWLCDQFAEIDGPYESEGVAYSVLRSWEQEEYEARSNHR